MIQLLVLRYLLEFNICRVPIVYTKSSRAHYARIIIILHKSNEFADIFKFINNL